MITGSSALYNAGKQQIVTPKIRVSITGDEYLTASSYSAGNNDNILDAVYFQGKMVVLGVLGSSTADANLNIKTYTFDGVSLISGVTIQALSDQSVGIRARLLEQGTTIGVYYIGNTGIEMSLSNNGTSWTGTTVLWNTTITGDVFVDLAPVSLNECYFNKYTFDSDYSGINEYAYGEIYEKGTTWNLSLITAPGTGNLNAIGDSVFHHLFYDTTGYEVIQSDWYRRDNYSKRTLFGDASSFKYPTIIGLEKGLTLTYMGLMVRNQYSDQSILSMGVITDYQEISLLVLKTLDLINWSVETMITTDIPQGTRYNPRLLAGKTVTLEYSLVNLDPFNGIGVSFNKLNVTRGLSSLDITSDILNLSINNNRSLDLTLGNMK